jgi:HPt (histidine-containing phosphotransfer) domain-containing protein
MAMAEALKVWRDPAVYRRFLAKFAHDNAGCVEKLRGLLEQGERGQAGALAHKIKGSAGNLSLPALARAADRVEHRLMEGGDPMEDLAPLQAAFDEACRLIQAVTAAAEPPPVPAAPASRSQLRALLDELLAALDGDNPDLAAPVLRQLDGLLPEASVARLRGRVDDFDFRGAEQEARALVLELEAKVN